ncbi:hypothetical protein NBRC116494_16820 [Aurantivibrio plasticivorans]
MVNSKFQKLALRVEHFIQNASPVERRLRQFNKSRQKLFYKDFWAKPSSNIGANIESLGYGYERITLGDRSTIVNGSAVMLDDHLTLKIMGHKPLTYKLLSEIGSNVPKHILVDTSSVSKAYKFLSDHEGAIVVKPAFGTGAGRGVTTRVKGPKELKKALKKAAYYNNQILLEEQLSLNSYRLLYLDGKLIDAVERQPPSIVGDGKSSVKQLLEQENSQRINDTQVRSLFLVSRDLDLELSLECQGLSLKSVPVNGQYVFLKTVINQNNRFENICVLDAVHPSIESKGSQICKQLGIALAGVDLMAPNVTEPWSSAMYINEVNTTPGLHHHYLVSTSRNSSQVAEKILGKLLSEDA